jgi:hypothetical protein
MDRQEPMKRSHAFDPKPDGRCVVCGKPREAAVEHYAFVPRREDGRGPFNGGLVVKLRGGRRGARHGLGGSSLAT